MTPCISQVTTLNSAFEDDLGAFSRAGWPAVELWLTKLETYLKSHSIEDAKSRITESGLVPLAAASHGGLLISQGDARSLSWELFRRRLDLLEALAVPTLIITPDFATELGGDDIARAVDSLAEAADVAGRARVRLALEFQGSAKFCASLDTTIALIAQADSANVGVCLDLFHYYTGPSKYEDLAYLSADNLAWVQVCDVAGTPRELSKNSDRVMPGDGDFQIGHILEHVMRIGYAGGLSLELLNPQLWQVAAPAVADSGLRAMARVLDALPKDLSVADHGGR